MENSTRRELRQAKPVRDRGHAPAAGLSLTPESFDVFLRERLALAPGAALLLAYSGGPDSEVLLHLAAGARKLGWRVRAVHVNHGLAPQADEWEAHCRRRCDALAMPLICERVTVTERKAQGYEAAARAARYECFARQLAEGEHMLTAHHRDDQAETVLLQLFRGSGCHGLAAMPARAPFASGWILRPLLHLSRAELRAYAGAHNLTWVDDPSNRNSELARAYLRERVLPGIERYWPDVAERLAATAAHAADAVRLLDELAGADLRLCRGPAANALAVGALASLAEERRRNLLRFWFVSLGLKRPSARRVRQIEAELFSVPAPRRALELGEGLELRRHRGAFWLRRRAAPESRDDWALLWKMTEPLTITQLNIRLFAVADTGRGLSRARVQGRAVQVRGRRGGERLRLPGRSHHHSVKKLLQEAAIPPWERLRLPLVYIDGQLAAIGDRWVAAAYAAEADEPSWRLKLETLP